MAITYQPAGYGAVVEQRAREAGAAIAASRAQELALNLEARREAATMEFNMKKDLAQIEYQMELEKFARAKAWDIEKMEVASRLDFEQEERLRLKKKEQFNLDMEALTKAHGEGLLDDDEFKKEKQARLLKEIGLPESAAAVHRVLTEAQVMGQIRSEALKQSKENLAAARPSGIAGINVPTTSAWMETDQGNFVLTDIGPIQIIPGRTYRGIGPDGNSAPVPAEKVQTFLAAGGHIVQPESQEIKVAPLMQIYLNQIPGIVEAVTGKTAKPPAEALEDIDLTPSVPLYQSEGEMVPLKLLTPEEEMLYLNYGEVPVKIRGAR